MSVCFTLSDIVKSAQEARLPSLGKFIVSNASAAEGYIEMQITICSQQSYSARKVIADSEDDRLEMSWHAAGIRSKLRCHSFLR